MFHAPFCHCLTGEREFLIKDDNSHCTILIDEVFKALDNLVASGRYQE